MEEYQKNNLFATFNGIIQSIIEDKKKNPKNLENINNFKAKINIGLLIEKDYIFWLNLMAENGKYTLEKGTLEYFDFGIVSAPEDMMAFCTGENSVLHMLRKKNKFGCKKLQIKKGTSGHNLLMLLKLPKILVLDKIEPSNS